MNNASATASVLAGSNTLASSQLSFNSGYLSQSGINNIPGINSLTEHLMLGIGCSFDTEGWATMIDTFYQTLQRNSNRTPAYTQSDLSLYASFVETMVPLIAELARDISVLLTLDGYAMSLPRDILGPDYTTLFNDMVKNRDLNISSLNFFADNFRNRYPLPATSRRNLGTYLLGNYFRDDSRNRGQYIMFHSPIAFGFNASSPYAATFVANKSVSLSQSSISDRIAELQALETRMLSSEGSTGKTLASVVGQIAADITRVYGAMAYYDAPVVSSASRVTPVEDPELEKALNFDAFGKFFMTQAAEFVGGFLPTWAPSATPATLRSYFDLRDTGSYPQFFVPVTARGAVDITDAAMQNIQTYMSQRPVIHEASDGLSSESLLASDLLFSAELHVDAITKTDIYAVTAAGYPIGLSWFNEVQLAPSGAFNISRPASTLYPVVYSTSLSLNTFPNALGLGVKWQEIMRDMVRYEWVDAVTPGYITPDIGTSKFNFAVHAEVDEISLLEYSQFHLMLPTLSQRYNDMVTLFATKVVEPKVFYKQGAQYPTIRNTGRKVKDNGNEEEA